MKEIRKMHKELTKNYYKLLDKELCLYAAWVATGREAYYSLHIACAKVRSYVEEYLKAFKL